MALEPQYSLDPPEGTMKTQNLVERFEVEAASNITDLDLAVELLEPRLEMAALDVSALFQPMVGLLPDKCKILPSWYGWFRWFFGC
jgi:hypothetical protein